MDRYCATARTLCLVNENARCQPIWVARPEGLKLSHFPELQREMTGKSVASADAEYDRCERECLACGRL